MMIKYGAIKRVREEADMICVKTLSRHLLVRTEENAREYKSITPIWIRTGHLPNDTSIYHFS